MNHAASQTMKQPEAQENRLQSLEQSLRGVIAANQATAETYFSLGLICKSTRRAPEAARHFAQAVKLRPDYPEAYNSLGLTLCLLQRLDEAQACLEEAIKLRDDYAEAYNNLGIIQVRRKKPEEAVDSFRRAVELGPVSGKLLNNLGLVLYGIEEFEESLPPFRQAMELDPDDPEIPFNLGCSLKELKRFADAIPYFQRAIELSDDFLDARDHLATMYFNINRFAESEAELRDLIARDPYRADAHRKLGRLAKTLHRLDEAEASYLKAIELSDPDEIGDAEFGYGILCLLRGQFEAGWRYYDLRRELYHYPEPEFPYWHGESLQGKRILLFCEQGYGDTIQFVRYAARVAALAQQTDVRVQIPLEKLVAASLPHCTVFSGHIRPSEHYDYACSLHSLPYVFRSGETDFADKVGYLATPDRQTRKWGQILKRAEGGRKFRIGFVWAGNPKHHGDHNRSIPFGLFSPLLAAAPVTWVSLQVGVHAPEIEQVGQANVLSFADRLTDYYETAGLVQNLDMVITVDTSVAHLSGALGKPVWLLLPYAPDWRWQLDREDTPWYPNTRLFRQPAIDSWPQVLVRVAGELRRFLRQSGAI